MIASSLSIIMSVYHPKLEHLDKTIVSVLEQSMCDFEFIIIQDDDLEMTRSILLAWQKKDVRIKLIENRCNLGLITSLNKGLDASKADLIARIDVGDWWDVQKLEMQKNLFDTDENLVLCGSEMYIVNEVGKSITTLHVAQTDEAIRELLMEAKNPFFHPSVMFRKTVLRYNKKALYCEDYELWCRYSMLGKMSNINQPLTYYQVDSGSITQSKRALMILNTTNAYCAFMKSLYDQDVSFINKGLVLSTVDYEQSFFEKISNSMYSRAVFSEWSHHTICKLSYFLLAIVFNPTLIIQKLKRFTCKQKFKKTTHENHPS
ncbi:MAG: glycosyltransferase [Sulfurospirillaceae bacterium]|nr:glycosyltransferase [Sulfurospirillaceae bacterium]MDD2826335.1 glycosyltransferase [Sulfurospirillaceae bacterium]